jgi:aldose 1-epimerase
MITLRLGDATAVVAPESGGALAGWTSGATRLLRMPLTNAVLAGDVHGMGAFPLLPYANRIGQARFMWEGQTYHLRRNMPGQPHALHGVGWARPWQIEALSDTAISLRLRHTPDDDWPFAFDARQDIVLTADSLRVTLGMTNRHKAPAPAGIGLHPYFPRAPGAALRFDAQGVWRNDPTQLPVEHSAIPPGWNHTSPREIGSVVLDNCFTGWPHHAELTWPGHAIRIEADTLFGNLQVYTPPGEAFFAVEPVSHAPDAINRLESMHRLAPGEALEGAILFNLTGL